MVRILKGNSVSHHSTCQGHGIKSAFLLLNKQMKILPGETRTMTDWYQMKLSDRHKMIHFKLFKLKVNKLRSLLPKILDI